MCNILYKVYFGCGDKAAKCLYCISCFDCFRYCQVRCFRIRRTICINYQYITFNTVRYSYKIFPVFSNKNVCISQITQFTACRETSAYYLHRIGLGIVAFGITGL